MNGLPMCQCAACGHVHFPTPLLCPKCHASQFEDVAAASGTVVGVTTWSGRGEQRQFAAVQTTLGPVVVALVTDGGAQTGESVLFDSTPYPQARTTAQDQLEPSRRLP